jgi:hypothetical protein
VDTCSLSQLLPPNLVRLIDRLHRQIQPLPQIAGKFNHQSSLLRQPRRNARVGHRQLGLQQ